jgi:hypothetical protein
MSCTTPTGTSKSLRPRKGSVEHIKDPTKVDFAALLRETEERIKNCFKDEIKSVTERLDKIERNISVVQTECVRLDAEVTTIKRIIVLQQQSIERNEERLRESNLILNNIPENEVIHESKNLKSDPDKLVFIGNVSKVDLSSNDVVSTHRLGKKHGDKPRPLKVVLKDKDTKFKILNERKNVAQNKTLLKVFGSRVYINPDSSFLVQKENFRLRQRKKALNEEYPDIETYIRAGVLYHDGKPVDKVNIEKQLF